jgi:hypothetical protein
MYIRRTFQAFLHLQSDAAPPDAEPPTPAPTVRVWPMDHTPRPERPDWTLDWRWFGAEADR